MKKKEAIRFLQRIKNWIGGEDYVDALQYAITELSKEEREIQGFEIGRVLQDFTREDESGIYYYIHDKDFIKLVQALLERFRITERGNNG